MLNADRPPVFQMCLRCGERGLQKFETHDYCVECNYSASRGSDEIGAIPRWAIAYLKTVKVKSFVKKAKATGRREEDAVAI